MIITSQHSQKLQKKKYHLKNKQAKKQRHNNSKKLNNNNNNYNYNNTEIDGGAQTLMDTLMHFNLIIMLIMLLNRSLLFPRNCVELS